MYLGSVVSTTGSTDQDVEARLGKASLAFRAKDKLLTSQIFGRATKTKIFNSSVKAVLLYALPSSHTKLQENAPKQIPQIYTPTKLTLL